MEKEKYLVRQECTDNEHDVKVVRTVIDFGTRREAVDFVALEANDKFGYYKKNYFVEVVADG